MKLKKTVKKIAAMSVGLGMMGATLMGAMAADLANFPTMFVNDEGKFDGVFVVGANAMSKDIVGQSLVQSAVQSVALKKTPVAGATASAVVSEGYELGNKDFYFEKSPADIGDDELTSAELPDMLADETYEDNEGSNKFTQDYKQKLKFENIQSSGTFNLTFDQDDSAAPNAGQYLYFRDNPNAPMFNYTLTFDTQIAVDNTSAASMANDIEGTTINLQGKLYSIVDVKYSNSGDMTEMSFLGGEDVVWISQGEKILRTMDGTEHTIELVDVTNVQATGETEISCGFLVDGQSVWIDKGTTETVNGIVLGVTKGKAVHSESQDTDVCRIAVGAREVKIIERAETKVNEQKLSDVTSFYSYGEIDYNGGTSTKRGGTDDGYLKAVMYNVNPDSDKLYLSPGDEVVDPVFGNFKLVFAELVEDDKETIEIKTSGKTGYLKFLNKDGREVTLDFKATGDDSGTVYLGDTSTPTTEPDDVLYFVGRNCTGSGGVGDCKGARFVVSSGSNAEAHVVKITKLDTVDNKISFEDLTYDTETNDKDYTDGAATSFSLAGISDSVVLWVDETEKNVTFKYLGSGYDVPALGAGSGVNWSGVRFKTENSGYVIVNNSHSSRTIGADGHWWGNTSNRVGNFSFYEYEDTGSVSAFLTETSGRQAAGVAIWPTYDASSDNALELDYISDVMDNRTYAFAKKDLSDTDSDNKKTMTYKGTVITIDDDNSKQSIVIEHPKVASYARVFAAPVAAETSEAAGSYTTELQLIGVDQFKLDTEVADPSAVNVIAIGGPCANSVTSALMGNPAECFTAMGVEAGQAMLKLVEDATTGKVALIVAGQTADDTRLVSKMLYNYKDYGLSGSEVVAITVSESALTWKTRAEVTAEKAVAAPVEAPVDETVPATE